MKFGIFLCSQTSLRVINECVNIYRFKSHVKAVILRVRIQPRNLLLKYWIAIQKMWQAYETRCTVTTGRDIDEAHGTAFSVAIAVAHVYQVRIVACTQWLCGPCVSFEKTFRRRCCLEIFGLIVRIASPSFISQSFFT